MEVQIMVKMTELKKVYGKWRKRYAVATSKADAERDKRVLERRGYKGVVITKGRGEIKIGNKWLKTTVYKVWALY